MKLQDTKRIGRKNGVLLGSVALITVCAGATWAGLESGKIELRPKDADKQAQIQPPANATLDPFRDMLRMQQEMDRMFGRMLDPYFGFPGFDDAWAEMEMRPAMDMTETADAYVVQMELPGMDKTSINIEVKDRVLTVGAEQNTETKKEDENAKVLVQERSRSSFSRQVVLPGKVEEEKVSAEYKDGVLTVTLPKAPQAKNEPRKIQVS